MPSRFMTISGIATWEDAEIEAPPVDPGAHPEQPIYHPVKPAHPIAPGGPIQLPPDAIPPGFELKPDHPIFVPIYPAHPIAPGGGGNPKPPDSGGAFPGDPGYNPPSGGNVPAPVKK